MKKYFIVFLITSSIFLSSFYISGIINDSRIKQLNSIQENLTLSIISTETRFALLKEASCENILKGSNLEIGITKELNILAKRIKFLENTLDSGNRDLDLLKNKYSLLQIKDYLLVKELSKKCDYKVATILYFHTEKCEECKNQSIVLDKIREDYNHVRVYWLDASLESVINSTMKDMFKIDKYPAMIIGKESYQNFVEYKKLAEIIEKWTTDNNALVETANPEVIKEGVEFILKNNDTVREKIIFVSLEKGLYLYKIKAGIKDLDDQDILLKYSDKEFTIVNSDL